MFNQIDAQINCHICLIIDWWTYCASILANKKIYAIIHVFCWKYDHNSIYCKQISRSGISCKNLMIKNSTTRRRQHPGFVSRDLQAPRFEPRWIGLSTGGSTNQAIAWLSHNIGNESYIIFFSNTFTLYIEIKTSTQTKSYVQTYPFKSIDGISSLDATFFSEEPENIKSPNLIKQLKKLQQWIQRNRTYRSGTCQTFR